jgi:outer membrane protein TolC
MKIFKLLLVLSILLTTAETNFAQKVMTLEQCIEFARENSPTAKTAISSFNSRIAGLRALRADLLPQLRLNLSTPGLVREINEVLQPDGSKLYLPQSQLFSSGSIGWQQKVAVTGGDVFITSGLSRIDVLEPQKIEVWRTTPIQITVRQPIFQFNNYYWDNKIGLKRHSVDDSRFVEDMENISLEVTRSFFDVYIAKINLENSKQNVAVNDTLFQLSKGRYEVGRIAENDLLQNELQLLNSQYELDNTALQYQRTLEEFAVFIGLDKNIAFELIPPLDINIIPIDEQVAVEQALNNRSDITDMEVQELEAESNLRRTQSQNRFNAVLSASFGLNQSAGLIDEAYRSLLDQERVNINLEVPLFTWGLSSARYQEALEQKNSLGFSLETRKKNIEIEIKYQTLQFDQLQRQIALSAKADTIANRRFEVAKNRFIIGKIDLNTLYIAQSEKDNALRSYIRTLQNYWVGYYNLRRLTLYDFKTNRRIMVTDYGIL